MEPASKEKFDKVIAAIKEMSSEVPTSVINAIDDAFSENPGIEKVSFYTKDTLDAFQSDLRIKYDAEIYTDGKGKLHTEDAYTYYGDLIYSQSEYLALKDQKDNPVDEIVNANKTDMPTIQNDPDDYAVVVIEIIDAAEGTVSRKTPILYIYVPIAEQSESSMGEDDGRNQ
jgi:hypothetical protein